jgi:deazaflavin-dependent oxidoreductase (nitroreductase family)
MVGARLRRVWFAVLRRTLNRLTLRLAKAGRGPFTIVRHRGRTSGREYETPIIVAWLGQDAVVELTYGDRVQWYRNVLAAGGCELVRGDRTVRVVDVQPLTVEEGLTAFGGVRAVVLRLLRRSEFRRFVVEAEPAAA